MPIAHKKAFAWVYAQYLGVFDDQTNAPEPRRRGIEA
jgi:hypothetical protein